MLFVVVFIVLCALIALEYCVGSSDFVFEAVIMLSERQTDIAFFSLLNLQHKRYYTFEN